jgi:ribonuclease Z
MGDNQKPLQIFFPRGDAYVGDMRHYLAKTGERLPFELQWTPLKAGQTADLGRGRSLETFPTRHMKESQSLGYKIIEARKRLKPEFADLGETRLRGMAQSGEIESATEEYRATRIAFGGDSLPIESQHIAGSEILVHEATILNRRDRKGRAHSTLDEALEVAQKAQPGTLVLNHFSSRYTRAEIETAIRHSAQKREMRFPIWILLNDKLRPVWIPAEQP